MNGWDLIKSVDRSLSIQGRPPSFYLFRQNMLLLLACFVFAVILWIYVAGSEQDIQPGRSVAHEAAVQIEFRHTRMRVLQADRTSVTVHWESRTSTADRASVSAWVDLGGITHAGRYTLPVNAQVGWDDGATGAFAQPDRITVFVDTVETVSVPVLAESRNKLPKGYTAGTPILSPDHVMLSGPSSLLPGIHASAVLDLSHLTSDADVTANIQLSGIDDSDLSLFTAAPGQVRIYMPVHHELQYVSVPVNPVFTGLPDPGWVFERADVTPSTVTVSGQPDALATMDSISTVPVDLTGRKNSFAVHSTLDPAAGVHVEGSSDVVIKVRLRSVSSEANTRLSPQR